MSDDLKIKQFQGMISDHALLYFSQLLENKTVVIRQVNVRKSKYGDFRYFRNKPTPVITVNKQMSSDALTFILAHEISHFLVYSQFGRISEPHGQQWKNVFSKILVSLVQMSCFSKECQDELCKFSRTPRATVSRGSELFNQLFPSDELSAGMLSLESLTNGELFQIPGHLNVFKKGALRRTRYVCLCMKTRKQYLFSRNLKVNTLNI